MLTASKQRGQSNRSPFETKKKRSAHISVPTGRSLATDRRIEMDYDSHPFGYVDYPIKVEKKTSDGRVRDPPQSKNRNTKRHEKKHAAGHLQLNGPTSSCSAVQSPPPSYSTEFDEIGLRFLHGSGAKRLTETVEVHCFVSMATDGLQ